jgi:hypothetical protein
VTRARDQLGAALAGWNRFWFEPVSTAPLAVFRIVFGLVVFFWTLSLLPDLSSFFTKSGILPQQPHYTGGAWGLFGTFPSHAAIVIVWTLLLVASIALVLGLFSQLAAAVVFVAVLSFERRNPWIFNSGDGLIRLVAFYLVFAPTSAALSLRRFLRNREEFWSFPARPAWPMRLLQLQFSAVYLFAVWDKARGTDWNNGTAVSIALRVTDLQRFPLPGFVTHSLLLSNLFSFGTLALELSLAILVWNRALRPYVLIAGLSLHLGIEYAIRVGFFSVSILSMYLLWVPPQRMEAVLLALKRHLSRTPAAAPVTAPSGGS